MDRDEVLAWEGRWAMPTALASFAAVALLIVSVVIGASFGGGSEAESLRDLHDQASTLTLVSLLQAAGFLLLVLPLLYVFRAVQRRVPRVRGQFLPLVLLAPVALGAAAVLNGVAAGQAADTFVNGEATSGLSQAAASKECRAERRDDAKAFRDDFGGDDGALADCATAAIEDDEAEDAIKSTSIRGVAEGIQFAGLLALAFVLVYSCLHAMRAGLLTRFWGSLGMAIGVASVLGLFQLGIIWFAYLGLLVAGWIPGGRPPAWAAGEAIPWPTPGEKAAESLEPAEPTELAPELEEPADPADERQSR